MSSLTISIPARGFVGRSRSSLAPTVHCRNLSLQALPINSLRIEGSLRWQNGRKQFEAQASKSDLSGKDSSKEKSSSDTAGQGPPFLTIVAGFLVFSLVLWIVISIIMWLFGLILSFTSSK